ncbi:RNA-binding protein [Methanoculleus sp. FWC-SCC3]|uniref:RNA-binding protein n=1 Tax=Methanoculleus methanifontis TaxID=2584086 RepID=A0ABT8LZB4_9EURY|nr:RNA-binding protein [Methanoculleus sp. FWC-SCC3]
MRLIGRSISVCGNRLLILRCDAAQLPRLYSEAVDRRLKPVGKVVDIFGNISSPYAVVLCYNGCSVQVGEKIFAR